MKSKRWKWAYFFHEISKSNETVVGLQIDKNGTIINKEKGTKRNKSAAVCVN